MDEHLNTHIGQSFEQPHCVNIWTTTLGEYLITHIGWIFEHTHWLNDWTPKLGKHLNTHNAWTFEHIHWKKLWTPTLGEYLNNHIEGTFTLKYKVFLRPSLKRIMMWEMEEDEEKKSATESTSGGISAIASSLPATRRWMRKWLLVIAPESERVRIFRGFEGWRKQMENIHVALILPSLVRYWSEIWNHKK